MMYRNALITGASSGLGRGLATAFAKRGVTVYAAARRVDLLESLRAELGTSIVPLALDVADADATYARISALDQSCGGLDLVVANAGIAEGGSQRDWSRAHQLLKVNVTGAVATLAAALPGMVERRRGHLVGVSSLAGTLALPRAAYYCASKAFLNMWLDGIRLDVEPHGVAVTCLQPGFVKTPLTADAPDGALPFLLEADDAVERMVRAIVHRDAVHAFPWPMATAVRLGALVPRTLRRRVLPKGTRARLGRKRDGAR